MKTVFIIGNGFDLSLGLKTQYSQFLKYYKRLQANKENILNLQKALNDKDRNWADLEVELGKYTKKIKKKQDWLEIRNHLVEKLASYLQRQENRFVLEERHKSELTNWLCFPESKLFKRDADSILAFKGEWKNAGWDVSIITLNYTKILEIILEECMRGDSRLGSHHYTNPIILSKLEHIHGYLDSRMILGVNDASQIWNELFCKDEEILESIVKPKYNEVCKHDIDRDCAEEIKKASLICIFGSSLGDTDSLWWDLIGEQLKKRECRLIIFWRDNRFNQLHYHNIAVITRNVQQKFLAKTNLSIDEKKEVLSKITIGINVDIFEPHK